MGDNRKICVGLIAGAHGVKGLVRLRSFTEDPEAIASYGPLTDESGERKFTVKLTGVAKDLLTASIDGVADRDAAEELHGLRLYAVRAKLPKTKKKEYYAGDLIGLAARNGGEDYGTVLNVHDHGAGVFLEIGRTRKDSFMLPFTDACVPDIDLDSGAIRIELPEGWRDQNNQTKKPHKDKSTSTQKKVS